jgi:hypothetical protein
MRCTLALLLLPLVTGCATYEFDITQPPELQRHVGRNIDQVFSLDSLEYRLRAVDNRLVMRVFNTTDGPIQLRGDRSTSVDPNGQSRPLRTQSIPPHSFAKIIFPPIRPYIYDPGPTFGIGVHGGIGHCGSDPFYGGFYDYPSTPRYLYVEDDTQYWDWKGESEIRVTLVYQVGDAPGEKEIRHDFTFRRRKM